LAAGSTLWGPTPAWAREILSWPSDESDRSFLYLSPFIAVLTNIDAEHLDHYGTLEEIKKTFVSFANKVPFTVR